MKQLHKNILCLRATRHAPRARSAIASLPAILLMGAVIVEVGVASIFLLSYLNNSVYGVRLSEQALMAARSGINDAISRVILNKNCGADSGCAPLPPDTYTVTAEGASAQVSICKDSCAGSGKDEVVSVGRSFTKQHRLVAILVVDSFTGLVTVQSIKDQPE